VVAFEGPIGCAIGAQLKVAIRLNLGLGRGDRKTAVQLEFNPATWQGLPVALRYRTSGPVRRSSVIGASAHKQQRRDRQPPGRIGCFDFCSLIIAQRYGSLAARTSGNVEAPTQDTRSGVRKARPPTVFDKWIFTRVSLLFAEDGSLGKPQNPRRSLIDVRRWSTRRASETFRVDPCGSL